MTPEQAAAFVVAQTALFNCELAAMVAENMQRAAVGSSMAYGADAFEALAARYEGVLGYNAVLSLFREVGG